MRPHPSRQWLWLACLALPLMALGHASLDQSTPANGSVVPTAPASIVLRFSESARLTAIGIQGQDGHDAGPLGPPPHTAGKQFVLTAPRLADGTYTVHYRVLATDDGHISGGTFSFTVGATSAVRGAQGAGAEAAQGYSAEGTVQKLDPSAGRVTIAHQAIAGLGWPAMTMTFAVKDTALYPKLSAGRHVQFTVAKQGSLYVVTQVH